MKLSLLTYALAAGGILAANANPLRVIFIDTPHNNNVHNPTSNVATVDSLAIPVDVVHPTAPTSPSSNHQTCRARFRQKAIAISNAFRQALGLAPIQADPTTTTAGKGGQPGEFKILPFIGTPGAPTFVKVENGNPDGGLTPPERGGSHHHRCGLKGFVMRLHRSLNALGPWEGKVVAFVLGCGIGVLLRMFWVLAVISYRSIKGDREPENTQVEYSLVLDQSDMESAEVIFVAPPSYADDADEKAALKEDAN